MRFDSIIWGFRFKKRALFSAYCYSRQILRLPYPPLEVFIEPTNYCNLRCIMCPQSLGLKRPMGYMGLDLFKKIIDEVKDFALKVTLHFAGESLLHKDIFGMVNLSKSHGLYTRLHTNGTLLTEEDSLKLIKSNLDELSFSFDSSRKDVYERIRLNAQYDTTLNNIRYLLKLKERLRRKRPLVIIQRINIGSENNFETEEEFKELFKGYRIDEFHFINAHNWAGDYKLVPFDNSQGRSACNPIWNRIAIGWDGKVYGCCNDLNGRLLIGDLNSQRLMEIWNNPPMINLRKAMVEGRFNDLGLCKDCDVPWRYKEIKMNQVKEYVTKVLFYDTLKWARLNAQI